MNAVAAVPLQPPRQPDALELVELSHSRKTLMQKCGRAYRFRYIDRLATKLEKATLIYGGTVHKGTSAALTAQALTGIIADPVPVFEREWSKATSTKAIEFSSNWDEDSMRKVGRLVLERFVEDWKARGWEPVVDVDGIPVIEREFKIRLPGNIIWTAIIDALVRTQDGKILVLDFKTPAQVSAVEFYMLSDQLLGYQVVCDAHAKSLGITQVDGAVFYELTKVQVPKTNKGAGPQIHVTDIVPRRSLEDINDWIMENQFIANDIRNKRYTRRPMSGYDTPCSLCDFSTTCRGLPDPNVYKRAPSTRTPVPLYDPMA